MVLHDKEVSNDDNHNLMVCHRLCYMNSVLKKPCYKVQLFVHFHRNMFEWLLIDREGILHSDIVVYIDEFRREGVLNMVNYMYSLEVGDVAGCIELWILFYHRDIEWILNVDKVDIFQYDNVHYTYARMEAYDYIYYHMYVEEAMDQTQDFLPFHRSKSTL